MVNVLGILTRSEVNDLISQSYRCESLLLPNGKVSLIIDLTDGHRLLFAVDTLDEDREYLEKSIVLISPTLTEVQQAVAYLSEGSEDRAFSDGIAVDIYRRLSAVLLELEAPSDGV